MALKGRNNFTPEGLIRLSNFQTNVRHRSDAEKKALRETALKRNAQRCTCPYCGKEGQYTAMHTWHFDHCPNNPNCSEEGKKRREQLIQRMKNLNQQKKAENQTNEKKKTKQTK